MKLILCRNNSIGSWFLRAVMCSRWSHSAVLDEASGLVYDSTMWQGGVRAHMLHQWMKKYPGVEYRDLTPPSNDADARRWLNDQVNKPYDWTALLSLVLQRNWEDSDSWFCSELSEAVRTQFGSRVFRADVSRITPHHQDIIK